MPQKIETEYKHFFKELYAHLLTMMRVEVTLDETKIRKNILDFAHKKKEHYEIKMQKKYRKEVEADLKKEIKKNEEEEKMKEVQQI